MSRQHLPGCVCSRCPQPKRACGCVGCRVLCAEAQRLWEACADAHAEATRNMLAAGIKFMNARWSTIERFFGDYDAAYEAYAAHFALPAQEEAEQSAPMSLPMA